MAERARDYQSLFQKVAREASAFRRGLASRSQRPEADYAELRRIFAEPTPEAPTEDGAVIEDLILQASPGLHAHAGPRFFGWVMGGSHPVGVAADWLTSAWGQNGGNHAAAPAAAAAEEAAGAWLLDLLDLPRDSGFGFTTGATTASFVCLAAARSALLRRQGWDVEARGLFGAPRITVLAGADSHTSIGSALQYLGFGRETALEVASDDQGRMRLEDLERQLEAVEGPCLIVTQAGQINTGAFDRHQEICELARKKQAWVHVDGTFGLWARASDEQAPLAAGVEAADSWATDGHKWLQTPYDCGYAIVRDAAAQRRAMTTAASYLPAAAEGERDPTQFVPELSRRARGFATWAMIKALGRQGLAEMISRHCRIARLIAERLAAEPGIEVLNDVVLNQIILRFGSDRSDAAGDALTRDVIARIQEEGRCFAGGATWRGRWVMRVSVCGWSTTEVEGTSAAEAMLEAWQAVRGEAAA